MSPGRNAGFFAATVLLVGFLAAGPARGGDLTTLSGQTFHDVQPVRVEPDGVTWKHAEGVAKVDFSDSPAAVRAAYHYDAGKAAAYHEARAQAQRQTDGQARQLLQARDDRFRARAQAQAAAQAASTDPASPAAPGKTLVYRHGLAPAVEAATRSVGEQMAAAKARVAADARNSEGLGDPDLWSWIPGMGSKPVPQRVDLPNSMEFTHPPNTVLLPTFGTSAHGAGAFGANSADDPLFKPIYLTKSYNDDVDRAAAFARGVPLK